jgi:serine/threonine protein phosphatase 1
MCGKEPASPNASSATSGDRKRRFAVGDIHGCFTTFRAMVEEKLQLRPDDTLILLGDYIDRGPGSRRVIDHIMHLEATGYNIVPLMGNHEFMMVRAMNSTEYFRLWHVNGSAATLHNFGVPLAESEDPSAVKAIPIGYIDYLKELKPCLITEDYFFVHAGVGNYSADPAEDLNTLLFTRDETYFPEKMAGRTVVHGHTPLSLEEIIRRVKDPACKVLNIDGGCVYSHRPGLGNLVALDLDSREIFSLFNRD